MWKIVFVKFYEYFPWYWHSVMCEFHLSLLRHSQHYHIFSQNIFSISHLCVHIYKYIYLNGYVYENMRYTTKHLNLNYPHWITTENNRIIECPQKINPKSKKQIYHTTHFIEKWVDYTMGCLFTHIWSGVYINFSK